MVMELTALTSTKDLLGASYGKTKLVGNTSSSAFSDLLPKDRQAADRGDSVKSGTEGNTSPAPKPNSASKDEPFKPDSPEVAGKSAASNHENEPARRSVTRDGDTQTRTAAESPEPGPTDRPQAGVERADAAPRHEGQSSDQARAGAEAGKPSADAGQNHTTPSPATPTTGSAEGNSAPNPGTAAALIASLAGTPAEPAVATPQNRTAPTAPVPVSGSPEGAAISPDVHTESASRAAAAYAAHQPQSPAPAGQTVTPTVATPTQPGTLVTPPPTIVPSQAAAATPDTAPPATATPAPASAPAPATVQPPVAASNTPTTPPPASTPLSGDTPSVPTTEQSTAQIVESLVRAGGNSTRRPRAGQIPGQTPASASSVPGSRSTTARSGTPQTAAAPTAVQPPTAAHTSPVTQSQPPVTIAAAAVTSMQASESRTGPTTESGRFTVDAGRPTVALLDQAGSTVIKTADSHVTAATRTARMAASVPVSEQVSVRIQKAVATGTDRIEVQLKPASLGRVNVALEFTHDGRVLAVVTADSPDTLDMLKQDARSLERALQDAGLKTDSGSLSFNLRGNGQDSAKAGNFGGDGHADVSEDSAEDTVPTEIPARMIAGSGLLDIHV